MISSGFSQGYKSLFGTTSTSWNILTGYCDRSTTDSLVILNDTSFNENNYKIIYNYDVSFNNYNDTIGYLREDTINGKAWYYDKLRDFEYLLFDLNLNVNDFFTIYKYDNTTFEIIVDSVFIKDNKKHIRLNGLINLCGEIVDTLEFIEGTGTTAGITYQGNYHEGTHKYLLCNYKDDQFIFGNSLYNDVCNIFEVSIYGIEKEDLKIEIIPNPIITVGKVIIKNTEKDIYRINIIDQLGRIVISDLIKSNEYIIDSKNLQSNIYYINISNQKDKYYSGKILINK